MASTSQKNEVRRAKRRRTLPGFPWEGSFRDVTEAKQYVAGDKIQCLLCGRWMKALGGHIGLHSLNETEYKQRFGIPYGVGLVAAPTAALHSVATRKLNASHGDAHREWLEKGRRTISENGLNCRPMVESVAHQRTSRIEGVCSASPIERACHKCGNSVIVRGSWVFRPDDHILCEECIGWRIKNGRRHFKMTEAAKERLRQWAEDNPERSAEYFRAKNWWGWRKNPKPLIEYARKWGAKLRIMPDLLVAQSDMEKKTSSE